MHGKVMLEKGTNIQEYDIDATIWSTANRNIKQRQSFLILRVKKLHYEEKKNHTMHYFSLCPLIKMPILRLWEYIHTCDFSSKIKLTYKIIVTKNCALLFPQKTIGIEWGDVRHFSYQGGGRIGFGPVQKNIWNVLIEKKVNVLGNFRMKFCDFSWENI